MQNVFKDQHLCTITVRGSTKNIGDHAAVLAADAGLYYMDGINAWQQEWLNREVKVTGDIDEEHEEKLIRRGLVLLLG